MIMATFKKEKSKHESIYYSFTYVIFFGVPVANQKKKINHMAMFRVKVRNADIK